MITEATEMMFAARSLGILEQALAVLREQLQMRNPDLLAITVGSYEKRIAELQSEIAQYVGAHPAAVSWLLSVQTHENAAFALVENS